MGGERQSLYRHDSQHEVVDLEQVWPGAGGGGVGLAMGEEVVWRKIRKENIRVAVGDEDVDPEGGEQGKDHGHERIDGRQRCQPSPEVVWPGVDLHNIKLGDDCTVGEAGVGVGSAVERSCRTYLQGGAGAVDGGRAHVEGNRVNVFTSAVHLQQRLWDVGNVGGGEGQHG